jgi:hypothetical protein
MSNAIMCDQCGETLALNSRGDDEMGEIAGWWELKGSVPGDFCSRSCVIEWLNRDDVVAEDEAHQEAISEIARAILSDTNTEGEEQ